MACRLFGTQSLPELMLASYQSHSWEHISLKNKNCRKLPLFIDKITIEFIIWKFTVILSRRDQLKVYYTLLTSYDIPIQTVLLDIFLSK